MIYNYQCVNIKCKKRNEVQEISKPMSEASSLEICSECQENLKRIFGSPSVKTGDGFKI